VPGYVEAGDTTFGPVSLADVLIRAGAEGPLL